MGAVEQAKASKIMRSLWLLGMFFLFLYQDHQRGGQEEYLQESPEDMDLQEHQQRLQTRHHQLCF